MSDITKNDAFAGHRHGHRNEHYFLTVFGLNDAFDSIRYGIRGRADGIGNSDDLPTVPQALARTEPPRAELKAQ